MKKARHVWTPEQEIYMRDQYANVSTSAIAQRLQLPAALVYSKAARMGLHKSEEFLASSGSGRMMAKGVSLSPSTQFKPGQVPPNKGLRRPGYAPGRMASTQFKKGQCTGAAAKNWRPIGTILSDYEGYLRIKVREAVHGQEPTGFGNVRVWPLLQRHVWEQANGQIPAGHVIVFRDKNRSNCDLDNLELVSRADLARRNSMWNNYPKELADVIQLAGALKRKLNRIRSSNNG